MTIRLKRERYKRNPLVTVLYKLSTTQNRIFTSAKSHYHEGHKIYDKRYSTHKHQQKASPSALFSRVILEALARMFTLLFQKF